MARDLTPGHGQHLVAAYKHAREARDPEAVMVLFDQPVEYHFGPFEPPAEGHIDVRAYWNALVARQREVEFDVETVCVAGRTVLCNWHAGYDEVGVDVRIRARGFLSMEVGEDRLIGRVHEWTLARPKVAGVA